MTGPTGRLLELLSLLQARRDWPGAALARRLEVTERTVRRDVERLRELGYRVSATRGPDGGYRLEPGSELPPLLFDEEQAVALAVALRLAAGSGASVADAAARALATVRQVLPASLRHRVDAVVVSSADTGTDLDPDVLISVSTAIRSHEVLRFDYGVTDEAAPSAARRAEPLHVVARRGRWYLVGWDLDRSDWRTYRLDRMRIRTPNGPRFTPRELPTDDVRSFVSARFKGATDHRDAWPCRGSVVLSASASEVAPYVGDGDVEALADGRCRVRLGAWSWIGLASAFGRFDADLEAVEPEELAEAFAVLARRYAAAGGRLTGPAGPPRR